MSSVDHRIVEMEFDNKDFEKRVSTTINSIDELKKSLEFKGVEKGFDNVSKSISGIGFDKVSGALDAVTSKFSIFGTVGDQVIRSLTNSVTSKLIVAFKEVEGVILGTTYSMEGFREYETKIKSIQTIAANTGALNNFANEAQEAITYSEEELKVAQDVILGLYSVGNERKRLLEEANYDYAKIQNKVDQIMSGIDDNGNAISNNVTTTLSDIDTALDDLNVYADKTIYNFTNMTQAIGKFTTAGIDLSTSVEAVKGVSNLAAWAGADNAANQRAMYNISQALQVGYMQLMDWRSIENAGMATAQFKEAIMDTARVHGIAIDQMIEEEGSFNLTLQKKWLTNDILIETLAKLTAFTEDMTEEEREAERARWAEIGYTQEQIAEIEELSRIAYESATKVRTFHQLIETTKEEIGSSYTMMWQNIIGNFDEATNLWTDVHNAIQEHFIGPMTKARDAKWKFFHDNGGREAAIEGLTNTGKGLLTIIHAITDAWKEVFPPDDGHRITALAKAFAEFSKRLIVSEETAEKIKMTFKGLFSVIHIMVTAIKVAAQIIGILIKAIAGLSSSGHPILELTSRLGALLVNLDEFLTDSGNIEIAIEKITNLIKSLVNVMEPLTDNVSALFADRISPKIQKVFGDLRNYIRGFVKGSSDDVNNIENEDTSGVETFGDKIKNTLGPILEKIEPLIKIGKTILSVYIKILSKILSWAKDAIIKIKDILYNSADNVSISAIFEAILGVQAFTMMQSIKKFFTDAQKTIGSFKKTVDGVNNILVGVKDVLEAYALDIKANVLLKIAGAVLMLCGSLIALSQIDAGKLWEALKVMSILMAELTLMGVILTKIIEPTTILAKDGQFFGEYSNVGAVLTAMATAILMMAGAVWVLSKLDADQMSSGLVNMLYLLGVMIGSVALLTKIMKTVKPKEIMAAALSLIEMAIAMNLMVVPLVALSLVPADKISNGLKTVLLLSVIMTGIIGALNGLMKLFKTSGKTIMSASLALIELAAAINMMVIPILAFSLIPYDMLVKGIGFFTIISGTLIVMFAAMAAMMTKVLPSDIMAAGLALMEIAMAINMLVIPLAILGILPVEVLTKGFASVLVALGMIVASLWLLPKDYKSAAKTLMALSVTIMTIAGVLLLLAPIKWENLLAAAGSITIVLLAFAAMLSQITPTNNTVKALQAIAVIAGVMAVSLYALSQVPGGKLKAAVIALLGLIGGIVALGFVVGKFQIISTGLANISAALISFGMSITLIGAGLLAIAATLLILSKIDYDAIKLGKLGSEVAEFITELVVGLVKGLEKILATLAFIVPRLAAYLFESGVEVLKIFAANVGPLIDALVLIFCGIADGIGRNAYTIVDHLMKAIMSIFDAISTWLSEEDNLEQLSTSITNFIVSLAALFISLCGKFVEVGWAILKYIGVGLLDLWTVYEGTSFYSACEDFGEDLYDVINGVIHKLGLDDLGKAIVSLISDGLTSNASRRVLVDAIFTGVGAVIGGIPGALGGMVLSDKLNDWYDAQKNSTAVTETQAEVRRAQEKANQVAAKQNTFAKKPTLTDVLTINSEDNMSYLVKSLNKAGKEAGNAYLGGVEESLGIESPSKKMEEIAKYCMEGFTKGLDGEESSVMSTIKNFKNNITDGFDMSDTLPMDTSEVINLDDLNTQFNTDGLTKDISGTMDLNTKTTNDISMDVSKQMDATQQSILDTTNNIYDELASLKSYISEIKIQLDSGALVGSLVGPMDTALGERSAMKGRGV